LENWHSSSPKRHYPFVASVIATNLPTVSARRFPVSEPEPLGASQLDVGLNRTVALKMILAGQLAEDADVKRFYAEAEAAANLDHPGIVPIFEFGQHEGQDYFSMGFVEGQSLAHRLADGPLPAREAAELIRRVTEDFEYAPAITR
jgi:serine/threonine protein kinase